MGELKLDFIVAGPQRTASSWLHDMLVQQPGVSLPGQVKETFFWDKYFEKGFDWYERFFDSESRGEAVRGEVAPTVFASKMARDRIHSVAPNCRVVIVVRDPVERMLSHYRHELALGLVRGSLEEAVRTDPRILEASRYSMHVPQWRNLFGTNQVHCIRYEAIQERPLDFVNDVCRFVGVTIRVPFANLDTRPSQASGVRFPSIARTLYRSASLLRRLHCHRWVNAGKRLGVRKLVQTSTQAPVAEADRQFAEEALREESETMDRIV